MRFQERDQSGLLVPAPPPEPPKQPEAWSLAFTNEHDRADARRALQQLHALTDCRVSERYQQPLRAKLIEQLAELLLGEPVEFEVKC